MASDDEIHKSVAAFIDANFEPKERANAALFLGQLTTIAMLTDPHISLPLSIYFLRMTLDRTDCEHCKEILRANLKDIN